MSGDHELLISYCTKQLLPIWERWMDGNKTMRLALQCCGDGPRHHDSQLSDLIDATFLLFHCARRPQCAAPLYAAIAVIYALQDYPLDEVVEFGLRSIGMHATAEEEYESRRQFGRIS